MIGFQVCDSSKLKPGIPNLALYNVSQGELLLDPVKRKPKMDFLSNNRNNLVDRVTQAYNVSVMRPLRLSICEDTNMS